MTKPVIAGRAVVGAGVADVADRARARRAGSASSAVRAPRSAVVPAAARLQLAPSGWSAPEPKPPPTSADVPLLGQRAGAAERAGDVEDLVAGLERGRSGRSSCPTSWTTSVTVPATAVVVGDRDRDRARPPSRTRRITNCPGWAARADERRVDDEELRHRRQRARFSRILAILEHRVLVHGACSRSQRRSTSISIACSSGLELRADEVPRLAHRLEPLARSGSRRSTASGSYVIVVCPCSIS